MKSAIWIRYYTPETCDNIRRKSSEEHFYFWNKNDLDFQLWAFFFFVADSREYFIRQIALKNYRNRQTT